MDIEKGVRPSVFQPFPSSSWLQLRASGSMLHEQTAETLEYLTLDTTGFHRPAGNCIRSRKYLRRESQCILKILFGPCIRQHGT